jgi:hypothetical protein
MPVQHQQVNEYLTCKKYKETYTPGFYDNYGRYIQGSVVTQEYRLIQTGVAGPCKSCILSTDAISTTLCCQDHITLGTIMAEVIVILLVLL